MKLAEPEPWMQDAACKGRHDINWLPERGESNTAAKAICEECPVRLECLDYGLKIRQPGIYGGHSDRERRAIARKRRRLAS